MAGQEVKPTSLKSHQCRKCGGRHLRRSRTRNFAEAAILPLLLIRPFRCADCKSRQYSLGFHRFRRFISSTVALILFAIAAVALLVFVGYVMLRLVFHV